MLLCASSSETLEKQTDLCLVQSLSHVRLSAAPWTVARMPGFLVFPYLREFAQTHVHSVDDADLCVGLIISVCG